MDIKLRFFQKYAGNLELRNYIDLGNKEEFIKTVENNRFTIIKKPRQAGLTTMFANYCLVNPEKKFLYVAANQNNAKHFIAKVKSLNGEEGRSESLRYLNIRACGVKALPHAVRGCWYDGIIVDEAAFMPTLDSQLSDLFLVLKEDGKLILGSTPHKCKGIFYQLYRDSLNKLNDFVVLNLQLSFNDEWVQNYMRLLNYNEVSMSREINAEFTDDKVVKKETIPAVRVEKLLYDLMLGRIDEIAEHTGLSFNVSDYIRQLVKTDIQNQLL